MAARPATGALRWRKSGHFRALRGDLFFWRWVGWRSGGGLTCRWSMRWSLRPRGHASTIAAMARGHLRFRGGGRQQYQSRIRRWLRRWALRRVRHAIRCSGKRATGGDSGQVRYGRVDTPINRNPVTVTANAPGLARHALQRQPAVVANMSATDASIRPLIAVASGHPGQLRRAPLSSARHTLQRQAGNRRWSRTCPLRSPRSFPQPQLQAGIRPRPRDIRVTTISPAAPSSNAPAASHKAGENDPVRSAIGAATSGPTI